MQVEKKYKDYEMPILKTVNTFNEIPTTNRWATTETFEKVQLCNVKGNPVNSQYQGRKFLLVERKEYTFSKFERVIRGFFGVVATICTLVIGVFFIKGIQNLFTKQKKIVDFAVALTPEQEKLITDFTPQMIEALGGVNKVMNIPRYKVTDKLSHELKKTIKDPLSIIEDNIPTIVFCYAIPSERQVWEQLERDGNRWKSIRYICLSDGQLHLGIPLGTINDPSCIADNSLEAKYMLDKISRLVHRKAVGVLKRYPNTRDVKPIDKDQFRPSDAYLNGVELESYMDASPLEYERKPGKGSTDVYLFDPKKSPQDNLADIQQKFPNTVLPAPSESISFVKLRQVSTGSLR
jgi:hypothetical protein